MYWCITSMGKAYCLWNSTTSLTCDYEKSVKRGYKGSFQAELENIEHRGFFVLQIWMNMTGRETKKEWKGVIKHCQSRVCKSQMSKAIKKHKFTSAICLPLVCAIHHIVICQGPVWTAVINRVILRLGLMTSYAEVAEKGQCFVIWHRWQ